MRKSFTACDDTKCSYTAAHLRELTTAGDALWQCALPFAQYAFAGNAPQGAYAVALGRGVLAVVGADSVVRGYAVPGAVEASEGWPSEHGGATRAGWPRSR